MRYLQASLFFCSVLILFGIFQNFTPYLPTNQICRQEHGYGKTVLNSIGYSECVAMKCDSGYVLNGIKCIDSSNILLRLKVDKIMLHEYAEHGSGCTLTSFGEVYCWGSSIQSKVLEGAVNSPIPSLLAVVDKVKDVAISSENGTCYLNDQGKVFCESSILVKMGILTSSAATDTAFGRFSEVQGISDVKKITVGKNFLCVLRSNNRVSCLGSASDGRLGIGSTNAVRVTSPTEVVGLGDAIDVQANSESTCAITSSKQLKCWGVVFGYNVATLISDANNIKTFHLTQNSVCYIDSLNKLYCSGSNNYGQLVYLKPKVDFFRTPQLVYENVKSFGSDGAWNHCVLDLQDQLFCWGPEIAIAPQKMDVPNLAPGRKKVIISKSLKCVILNTNEAQCWGGPGGTRRSKLLTYNSSVPNIENYKVIKNGAQHFCGIDNLGKMKCWGGNSRGELGLADKKVNIPSSMPITPPVPGQVMDVALSSNATCALNELGDVYCFGWILGARSMQKMSLGKKSLHIVSGVGHFCSLNEDTSVSCWGDNNLGQLGDGSFQGSFLPRMVVGVNASQVFAGGSTTCISLHDQKVHCWGRSFNNPPDWSSYRSLPIEISQFAGTEELYINQDSICSLSLNKDLLCKSTIFSSVQAHYTDIVISGVLKVVTNPITRDKCVQVGKQWQCDKGANGSDFTSNFFRGIQLAVPQMMNVEELFIASVWIPEFYSQRDDRIFFKEYNKTNYGSLGGHFADYETARYVRKE